MKQLMGCEPAALAAALGIDSRTFKLTYHDRAGTRYAHTLMTELLTCGRLAATDGALCRCDCPLPAHRRLLHTVIQVLVRSLLDFMVAGTQFCWMRQLRCTLRAQRHVSHLWHTPTSQSRWLWRRRTRLPKHLRR